MQVGEEFILTIRNPAVIKGKKGLGVSYEAFVDDVQVKMPKNCSLSSDATPSGDATAFDVLLPHGLGLKAKRALTQFSFQTSCCQDAEW